MSREKIRLVSNVVVLAVILCLTSYLLAAGQDCLSPTALVADKQSRKLYVAEATAEQVAVFDTKTAEVTATIGVPAEPTGLALTADGAYLYVTCAKPDGCICIIDTATNEITEQIPAGYGARAPVLGPDSKKLYVCNRFNNSVSVINTKERKRAM